MLNFALSYPEVLHGERTTPRSLVQLSTLLAPLRQLEREEALVLAFAESCLDREAAAAFLSFVRAGESRLLEPAQIVEAKRFETDVEAQIAQLVDKKTKRVDVLAVLCKRLVNHLKLRKGKLSNAQLENIRRFLLMPLLPSDQRLVLARELAALGQVGKELTSVPEVAALVLRGM